MGFQDAVKKGVEIVKLNRAAYREVALDPEAFAQALLITVLVGVAIALSPPSFAFWHLFLWPVRALAGLFIGTAILHFVATIFGGRGDYMVLLRVVGVGNVVGWARVIPFLGVIVQLWSIVIAVVALEELYQLDRTKAILCVVIPAAAILVLGGILMMFISFAALGAFFLGGW